MKFSKRTYYGKKNNLVNILVPEKIDYEFTATSDKKGYDVILSNGSGFNFIRDCLLIAANLQEDELLYVPIQLKTNEFDGYYNDLKYYKGLCFRNYCKAQISSKELGKILTSKPQEETIINITPILEAKYIESWKTEKRLTVKEFKENLLISTNKDGFVNLANGAHHFSDWGDDTDNNKYYGHRHYDLFENTLKSIGITFNYWQISSND